MILQFILYESGNGALTINEENMLRVIEDKRTAENFDLKERKAEHINVMVTF
jgi:hypothetical protein